MDTAFAASDQNIETNMSNAKGATMPKNTAGMNAYKMASSSEGYSNVPTPGAPNYSEAWALVEAARRMAQAIEAYARLDDPKAPKSRELLRDPLRLNWRLWTIFQAELINSLDDENSTMPDEIRNNMLTLCQFVDKHTTQALADPQPERLAVLIDINRNIASGLLENAGAAAPEATNSQVSGQPAQADRGQEAAPPMPSGISEEA